MINMFVLEYVFIFIFIFVFMFIQYSMQNKDEDMQRRSKFSFTAIDMLKVDPVSKLLFLQEPIIEKRFSNVLKVLFMNLILIDLRIIVLSVHYFLLAD